MMVMNTHKPHGKLGFPTRHPKGYASPDAMMVIEQALVCESGV